MTLESLFRAWVAALVLSAVAVAHQQPPAAPSSGVQPPAAQEPVTTLPAALAAKLPLSWHEPVARLLTIPDSQYSQLLQLTDEALRQTLGRRLVRVPDADGFVREQLTADPSPRVRSALAAAIANDARWNARPDTGPILERVIASDPDPVVSLVALDVTRRWKMRPLAALLASRLAAARAAGDTAAVSRLAEEQERWISLERGTMLPAFLRQPPPAFSVLPPERSVRVLALGDFGTGTPSQKIVAQAIAAQHGERKFDLAITVGDNFYTSGMASPADPRWQTWWEDHYGALGITFYATLGNHDWVHPDSPSAEILYRPASGSWRMPALYYTFTAGPVQFFALDTQSIAQSVKQLAWLEDELSRSTAQWKVVYGHHPVYSAGGYEDSPALVDTLLPVLRSRADAYLCGHDHNLQALSEDGGVHFYIAGGGGAGLYPIRKHERTVFAASTLGFAVLDADATRLTVALVDSTGKTVYENVQRKTADGSF